MRTTTHRKKRLGLGLALTLVMSVAPLFAFVADAYANSSGSCIPSSTVGCVTLKVRLRVTNGGTISSPATVTATRQGNSVDDNKFTLSRDGSNNANYTSGGPIWGTSPDDSQCSSNPTGPANKFKITVSGSAVGATPNAINLCANESPQANGDPGSMVKTVTVDVTASGAAATLGGIKGDFSNIDLAGNARPCDADQRVTFTGGPTGGKNASLTSQASSSHFDTGLILAPGTYTVSVNCSANGSAGPIDVGGIVVKAGETTDIGLNSCDAGSDGCGTPGGGPTGEPGKDGSDQDDFGPQLTCEVSILNPLTWLVCPLVAAAQGAVNTINDGIDTLMNINTGKGSAFDLTGNTGKAYRTAWNSFRVIGSGVIIIAGLMMIIAQAAGVEFIDAYTIRKTLPRLLVAAIFITLSWYVVAFFIQLSNDVGNSVRAIIYQPFSGIGNGTINLGQDSSLVASLAGGVAITALGLLGLGSFAIGALIAVIMGFAILMIRKLIILMLIITAPLAIACYVLPNTQRAFHFWRDTLISMLVVFPIISMFIAIGRVFAVVAYTSGGDAAFVQPGNGVEHGFAVLAYHLGFAQTTGNPGLLPTIEAFFAYFLPYLLMKQAFDLAGGLIRTIKGGFDNASAGIRGAVKGYRGNKAKENWGKLKSGNRFEGTKFIPGSRTLAKGANWASIGATHGMGITGKSRQSISTQRQMTANQMAKDPRWETIKDWDDAARAVANWDNAGDAYNGLVARKQAQVDQKIASGEMSPTERVAAYDRAKQEAKAAVNAVKATVGFGRPQQILGAQQFIATGTAPDNEADMVQTLARAAHGDTRVAGALAGAASGIAARAGRHDLNRGAAATQRLVATAMENGNVAPKQMLDDTTNAAFERENIYTHMNAKDASTKAYTEDFTRQYKEALDSGDRGKAVQIVRYMQELSGGLSQAKAGPAAAVRKALKDQQDAGNGTFTPEEMESIRREAAANNRTYGSGADKSKRGGNSGGAAAA